MKNWMICCLMLPVALFGYPLSPSSFDTYQKISLQEFSKMVHEGLAPRNLHNTLIECPAGSEVPFKFSLRGDVFSFEPTSDVKFSIKVLKTCYLTHLPNLGLVFSTDLQNWSNGNEFFIGRFSAAFMMENQTPTSSFELELYSQPYPHTKTQYSYRYSREPFPYHVWEPTKDNE